MEQFSKNTFIIYYLVLFCTLQVGTIKMYLVLKVVFDQKTPKKQKIKKQGKKVKVLQADRNNIFLKD